MRDVRVAITGHVDHGKSTLIGRLLYDTGNLPDGKAEEIVAASERRGIATEWSFAVDAAQEERDQAITIETTRVWLRRGDRRIVVIDTPGHREFIRNMMSGAADADAGILVIDAFEGIRDQTYRHAYVLQLLDVPEIVVVVNKIDLVEDGATRFAAIERDVRGMLDGGAPVRAVIPVSARDGDNVVHRSARTAWYTGPTVVEVLDALAPALPPDDRAFRFEVADVFRFTDERIAVGSVQAGTVAAGDIVRLAPSGARTRVRAVKRWPDDSRPAHAGEAIGLTFDDPVFVDRGDVVAHDGDDVPVATTAFGGVFFWLAAEPPRVGDALTAKVGRAEVAVTIAAIADTIDLGVLDRVAPDPSARHSAFALELRAARVIAADPAARAVLLRGGDVVAGGKLSQVVAAQRDANVVPHGHLVTADERAARHGYRGLVAWLTGLPGSGKSTLAMAVERELFARGYVVYVLDGDNLRRGLNADLGFAAADRAENVRRLGEVAALFADAGAIVLVSAISPNAEDRARARAAARGAFREIYVRASVAACESRDVKGHYRRARAGEIPDFTGISAPYDVPDAPDVIVDTEVSPVDACVHAIVEDVLRAASVRTRGDALTSASL